MKTLPLIALALLLLACSESKTETAPLFESSTPIESAAPTKHETRLFSGVHTAARTVNSMKHYYWIVTLETEGDGSFEFIILCPHPHHADVLPFFEKEISVELTKNFSFPLALVDLTNPPDYALECETA